MKPLAWIGLSVIAVFALYRLMTARTERTEAEIVTLKQAMAALSENGPRGDDARTARIVVELPRSVSGEPQGDSRPSSDPPSASASASANVRERSYADQLAYYHSSLQAENVDVNWSKDAVHGLRGIFDQLTSPATTLKAVECRQTICRAELTHDTEDESRSFMDKWMYSNDRMAWKGPITGGLVGANPDGSLRTVLFFAREGTELPALD